MIASASFAELNPHKQGTTRSELILCAGIR